MLREHNERMHLAWHIAALSRTPKKMPKLDSLLQKRAAPRLRQSWQQQLAVAQMWAGVGRGRVVAKHG